MFQTAQTSFFSFIQVLITLPFHFVISLALIQQRELLFLPIGISSKEKNRKINSRHTKMIKWTTMIFSKNLKKLKLFHSLASRARYLFYLCASAYSDDSSRRSNNLWLTLWLLKGTRIQFLQTISPWIHTLRSQEQRKWSATKEPLNRYANSPPLSTPKKCLQGSMEKMHIDVTV